MNVADIVCNGVMYYVLLQLHFLRQTEYHAAFNAAFTVLHWYVTYRIVLLGKKQLFYCFYVSTFIIC